ncbi:MAG: PIG-L family deacetylase [Acidobacteria bacterium]|nr:PIG-L family deacetylase [Acidobacteriota bacterium]
MEQACQALGIRPPLFLECADRGLAHDCWDSARDEIVRAIRTVRPDAVLTFGPDGISGHPDHVALNKIVTAAFWGAGAHAYFSNGRNDTPPFRPPRLYYVLRSASVPEFCAQDNSGRARPLTTVIDIRDYGDRKLKAIRSYRSQKHLQSEDPGMIDKILKEPEHFHRAVPLLEVTHIETDLLSDLSIEFASGKHRQTT